MSTPCEYCCEKLDPSISMRVRTVRAEGNKCGTWGSQNNPLTANKIFGTYSNTINGVNYTASASVDLDTQECVWSGNNPYYSGSTFSNEDTDAALKERIVSFLDPIGDAPILEFTGEFFLASANEFIATSYPYSPGFSRKIHSEYSIIHAPTITCYLKVWLQNKTVTGPYPYTTTFDDDFAVYEWVGTGNPCIADPTKSPIHVSGGLLSWGNPNLVTQAWQDLPIPITEGVTEYVKILKYSCVPGYEPDISDADNPQPNGFPDPAWEAAAP